MDADAIPDNVRPSSSAMLEPSLDEIALKVFGQGAQEEEFLKVEVDPEDEDSQTTTIAEDITVKEEEDYDFEKEYSFSDPSDGEESSSSDEESQGELIGVISQPSSSSRKATGSDMPTYPNTQWVGTFPECNVCGMVFMTNVGLRNHYRIHFKKVLKKVHKCSYCKRTFKHQDTLDNHLRLKHVENPLQCDVRSGLEPNTQWVGTFPECNVCGMVFMKNVGFRNHYRKHFKKVLKKVHKCSYCKRTFKHQDTLDNHLRLKHVENPLQCDVCEKLFLHPAHRKIHRRAHKRELTCVVCRRTCNSVYDKANHRCSKNNINATPIQVPILLNATPIQVPIQLNATPIQVPIQLNATPIQVPTQLNATPIQVPIQLNATPLPRKQYKCYICTKFYTRRGFFNKHLIKKHREEIEEDSAIFEDYGFPPKVSDQCAHSDKDQEGTSSPFETDINGNDTAPNVAASTTSSGSDTAGCYIGNMKSSQPPQTRGRISGDVVLLPGIERHRQPNRSKEELEEERRRKAETPKNTKKGRPKKDVKPRGLLAQKLKEAKEKELERASQSEEAPPADDNSEPRATNGTLAQNEHMDISSATEEASNAEALQAHTLKLDQDISSDAVNYIQEDIQRRVIEEKTSSSSSDSEPYATPLDNDCMKRTQLEDSNGPGTDTSIQIRTRTLIENVMDMSSASDQNFTAEAVYITEPSIPHTVLSSKMQSTSDQAQNDRMSTTPFGNMPLSCSTKDVCEKTCDKPNAMLLQEEDNYKCNVCSKTYSKKEELNEHWFVLHRQDELRYGWDAVVLQGIERISKPKRSKEEVEEERRRKAEIPKNSKAGRRKKVVKPRGLLAQKLKEAKEKELERALSHEETSPADAKTEHRATESSPEQEKQHSTKSTSSSTATVDDHPTKQLGVDNYEKVVSALGSVAESTSSFRHPWDGACAPREDKQRSQNWKHGNSENSGDRIKINKYPSSSVEIDFSQMPTLPFLTEMKHYTCDACEQVCFTTFGIQQHLWMHTEKGNAVRCMFCRRPFKCKRKLSRHVRTNHGENPFACDVCKEVFPLTLYMKLHRNTHEAELTCEVCGKVCDSLFHLHSHTKEQCGDETGKSFQPPHTKCQKGGDAVLLPAVEKMRSKEESEEDRRRKVGNSKNKNKCRPKKVVTPRGLLGEKSKETKEEGLEGASEATSSVACNSEERVTSADDADASRGE